MGIENGEYSQMPEFTEQDMELYKKQIDIFTAESGLYEDVLNILPGSYSGTKIRCRYENYFREKYPAIADYVMEKSDPKKVEIFDQLVDEYNEKTEIMSEDERKNYIIKFRSLMRRE